MAGQELNIDELIDVPAYQPDRCPDNDVAYTKRRAWKKFKDELGDSHNIRRLAMELETTAYHLGADPRLVLSLIMRHFVRALTHTEQLELLKQTLRGL